VDGVLEFIGLQSEELGIAQVILMGLGNKKGHVQGSQVSGGHTTLIDGADDVTKKLGVLSWFESVRPGIISVAKGGKPQTHSSGREADAELAGKLVVNCEHGSVSFLGASDVSSTWRSAWNGCLIREIIGKVR
jgi:hypothetical protein